MRAKPSKGSLEKKDLWIQQALNLVKHSINNCTLDIIIICFQRTSKNGYITEWKQMLKFLNISRTLLLVYT